MKETVGNHCNTEWLIWNCHSNPKTSTGSLDIAFRNNILNCIILISQALIYLLEQLSVPYLFTVQCYSYQREEEEELQAEENEQGSFRPGMDLLISNRESQILKTRESGAVPLRWTYFFHAILSVPAGYRNANSNYILSHRKDLSLWLSQDTSLFPLLTSYPGLLPAWSLTLD